MRQEKNENSLNNQELLILDIASMSINTNATDYEAFGLSDVMNKWIMERHANTNFKLAMVGESDKNNNLSLSITSNGCERMYLRSSEEFIEEVRQELLLDTNQVAFFSPEVFSRDTLSERLNFSIDAENNNVYCYSKNSENTKMYEQKFGAKNLFEMKNNPAEKTPINFAHNSNLFFQSSKTDNEIDYSKQIVLLMNADDCLCRNPINMNIDFVSHTIMLLKEIQKNVKKISLFIVGNINENGLMIESSRQSCDDIERFVADKFKALDEKGAVDKNKFELQIFSDKANDLKGEIYSKLPSPDVLLQHSSSIKSYGLLVNKLENSKFHSYVLSSDEKNILLSQIKDAKLSGKKFHLFLDIDDTVFLRAPSYLLQTTILNPHIFKFFEDVKDSADMLKLHILTARPSKPGDKFYHTETIVDVLNHRLRKISPSLEVSGENIYAIGDHEGYGSEIKYKAEKWRVLYEHAEKACREDRNDVVVLFDDNHIEMGRIHALHFEHSDYYDPDQLKKTYAADIDAVRRIQRVIVQTCVDKIRFNYYPGQVKDEEFRRQNINPELIRSHGNAIMSYLRNRAEASNNDVSHAQETSLSNCP